MKRLFITLFMILGMVTLFGCTNETPALDLIGDSVITINKGDSFIDPGVNIVGDFDLEIESDTDLDVNTVGSYEITYTITFNGVEINETRTVVVVDGNDETPTISLNGAETIYIDLYGTYEELGAIVVGDFDLTIDVSSNVDTSSVGEYQVTYSIIFNEVTISISRTVIVVDYMAELSSLNLNYQTQEVTMDSIRFFVTLDDDSGYLSDLSADIYLDAQLLETIKVNNGDNYITFDELSMGTSYTIKLNGTFDNGLVTFSLENYEIVVTTLVDDEPNITISSEQVLPKQYQVTISIDDSTNSLVSAAATLYKNDEVWETKTLSAGSNDLTFSNLIEQETYHLEIEYVYTDSNTSTNKTETLSFSDFDTPEIPLVPFEVVFESSFNSITCKPSVTTDGFSQIALSYQIFQDNTYLDSINVTSLTEDVVFSSLDSGTEYTIKVFGSYHHDATNVDYSYMVLLVNDISTVELSNNTIPSVSNFTVTEDFTGADNKITFEFDFNDPDSAVQGSVYLKLDYGSLKASLVTEGHNVIVFEGYYINENVTYEYYVQTDYLLNDDTYLNRQKVFSGSLTTPISIPVLDFEEYDTVFVGDHTILKIVLDNETEEPINHFTVNGVDYSDYVFPSNNQAYYIDLGVSSESNTTIYALTEINVTLVDGTSYDIPSTSTTEVSVHEQGTYVPDDAYVKILDITTEDRTIYVPDDETSSVNVKLHLDNVYNLQIESFKINNDLYTSSDFTISNNVISFSVDISRGGNSIYVSNLKYIKNNEEIVLVQKEMQKTYIYGYYSEDIVIISSVSDFLNINPNANKYYKLNNDLDFDGIIVNPLGDYNDKFTGCFDGNGHVMSNISISYTATSQDSTIYVGLFGYSQAYLVDITIDNIDVSVVNSPTNPAYNYVGTLAGISNGYVNDVHIIGNSSVTISGLNKGSIGGLFGGNRYSITIVDKASANTSIVIDGQDFDDASYNISVGGLIGNSLDIDIRASHSSGSIVINNTDDVAYFVGGLAGSFAANSNYSYISNSYATVDITTTNTYYGEVGGLVGRSTNVYETGVIINSYSSGDVFSSHGKIGGLVGGSAIIYNSMSFGNLSSTVSNASTQTGYASYVSEGLRLDRFIYVDQVFTRDSVELTNPNDLYTFNLIEVSEALLNTQSFYETYLNWNPYFYHFYGLDISNKDLPVHS